MPSRMTSIIAGLIAIGLLATFVIGLSLSISQGFAGFFGGLPFAIIILFVLALALYDFYDTAIKQQTESDHSNSAD